MGHSTRPGGDGEVLVVEIKRETQLGLAARILSIEPLYTESSNNIA